MFAGTVVLLGALEPDSGPEAVFVPMLLIGLGIGALASQLGADPVAAQGVNQRSHRGVLALRHRQHSYLDRREPER